MLRLLIDQALAVFNVEDSSTTVEHLWGIMYTEHYRYKNEQTKLFGAYPRLFIIAAREHRDTVQLCCVGSMDHTSREELTLSRGSFWWR